MNFEGKNAGLLDEPAAQAGGNSREDAISRVRLLWHRRGFLLRVVLGSFVLSAVLVLLIPKRYEAETRLMPPDGNSGLGAALLGLSARSGGSGMSLGGVAGDLLGVKNSGALFIGILSSRTVEDRLIQEFDLQRVYGHAPMEDLRAALAKHTGIAEDRKSGIISITVIDHDPRRATAMATAYVLELDRLVADVSTSSARRERIFLEERLTAVKRELDGAAGRFSQFASQNTAIDIPAQGKAMVEAAARLQGELIAAEAELRGLEAMYTDQNVRVRALRARVSELHAQLEKLGGDMGGGAVAGAPEAAATMYPSIRKLPLLGVKYADLYRQTKIQETVFELLTQQYELAKVQEAKEIPSVKVLDAAVVPTKKSFPPRTLLVFVAVCASLLLACAWLLAGDFWKRIDPQEPGKQFLMEMLGTLQLDAARLVPQGSLLGRAILRLRAPKAIPAAPAGNEPEPAAARREVARMAGNTAS